MVNRTLLYPVCTSEFHYIMLDSRGTLNKHLSNGLFHNDNLHLNRKGYEKLSKLLIGKIEPLQTALQRQNLKASKNYTETVSFSKVDINSLLYYQCIEALVNLCVLLMLANICPLLILANIHMPFYISTTFISNARLKLAKNQANSKEHSEAELLLLF